VGTGAAVILPLAVFAPLAAACAPQVAPQTLAAYAQVESGRDPLVIGDNTAHRALHFRNAAEALAAARRLLAKGHDLDLGLMQINDRNLALLRLPLDRAFDVCASLRAGADYLELASRYNTGSPTRGFANGYVARIVRASFHLPALRFRTGVSPAPPAPVGGSSALHPIAAKMWRPFGKRPCACRPSWQPFRQDEDLQ
jgi:type IV secretion system protein VirB1